MTISEQGLAILIYVALAVTAVAPLALLGLWIKDLKKDTLW